MRLLPDIFYTTKDVYVLFRDPFTRHYHEVRTRLQILFGERLQYLRARRKWSQEDLSERSKISIRHIGSLENGHREPCLETLVSLATAFGMKASELIENLE